MKYVQKLFFMLFFKYSGRSMKEELVLEVKQRERKTFPILRLKNNNNY